ALMLAAAVIIGLAVPTSAKDAVVESLWTARPLTVDGVAQEWEDANPVFDKASGAQYALKNDGQDLYIVMVLRDQVGRSTIDYTGMKIFVTAGPKKSKDTGVLFMQKSLTPDELIASLEKKGETLTDERKAEIRKQTKYAVFVEEAITPKKGAAASETDAGLAPALFRSVQKGQVSVYEFKIPLSRIGEQGSPVQPGSAIKVGFEWGGMTKEIMKNLMADRASSGAMARQSQGSSDSGFRDNSGEGGYEGPDFSYSRDKRFAKHSFWIDVKLAQAK
ncbi:MAG TPA: hypothetical protein VKT17_08160, partial [Acidobacteriota bacterium]|nr:hypothetical protein [Acidobacteriota bacterium]